jgi:HAMP domain-containing protein
MKKIFLIIGLAAVMSNAGCGYECNQRLERIANALERIANSMEKQQIQAQKEATPKKIEITHLNGRSLKAIPTDPYSIMDNNEINQCMDDCKIRFSLYSEKVDCIKRYCGENQ